MTIIAGRSGGNLDSSFNAAVTKLTRFWQMGYKLYQNTLLDEIALVDMSSRDALLQLGMVIDGSTYKVCSLTDKTIYSENPPLVLAEVGFKRMDLFGIEWSELADDFTKRVTMASLPELGGKPAMMPLLEVLYLLNSNPVTKYDGLALFHAAHKQDPFKGSGTHGNIITAAKSSPGWNAVLQAIMTRQDPGSKPQAGTAAAKGFMPNRNLTGKNLIIWTGDTGVASDLAKIFDPQSNWATFPTTTNGASETRKVYAQAAIQYVPEMSLYGTITNYCYVLVNNRPNRGVFARIPDAARVDPIERIPNQHMSRVKGWQTWGLTTADPFSLYRWDFS